MKWLRITIVVIGILVLLVVLLIPLGGYLLLRRSFPTIEGTVQVAGLKSPVEVYRDKWGVPHIYAQSVEDLFFAQGYVTAQDRLWQMEFNRRIGSGTLSEVLGRATLENDRFIRTIGWRRVAEEEAANLDEETRTILEAYAAGVNAFIDKASLPPEFLILGFKPDPWTPADSIAWGKVMAWDLGGNWEAELLRASLIEEFGEEKANQLAPPYPAGAPLIIPSEALGYQIPGIDHLLSQARQLRKLFGGAGLGSNNWVIDGQKSATGMPLLANDIHLGIQMPSIWYEVHLVGGGFNVEGYSFPGVPAVIVGHNEDIAWAVTNVGPDVQDLYIEKVNPANPDQYEYRGQWLDMEIIEEEIKVKGQDPVVETVRLTRHGPIITPVVEGVTETLALRWTASEPNQIFKSVVMLNRAKNWEEFQEALGFWAVPSQNFVYADREGSIGYHMPGSIPVRPKGQGLVPVPGWTGEYEWEGYIPSHRLPHTLNPSTHYIVTANNKVVGDQYPYFISRDWDIGHRAQRIKDLLETKSTLSLEDIKAIHADTYSLPAEIFMPYLLAIEPEGWLQERAMNQLKKWDLSNDIDSTGAGLFQVFYLMLVKNTFADELGEEIFADYLGARTWHHMSLEAMMKETNSPWFDDVTTPEGEKRDDIVRRSFAEACDLLGGRFGDVPHEWTWGRLHTATFDHPLGAVKPLDLIFNRGPIPTPGSGFTVNAASFDYSAFAEALKPAEIGEVFAVQSGVSQRLIVDLSDFSNSLSIHTTGQVGIPFHKHYGDMITSWQGVRYHPLLWERDEIERNKEGLLILEAKSE